MVCETGGPYLRKAKEEKDVKERTGEKPIVGGGGGVCHDPAGSPCVSGHSATGRSVTRDREGLGKRSKGGGEISREQRWKGPPGKRRKASEREGATDGCGPGAKEDSSPKRESEQKTPWSPARYPKQRALQTGGTEIGCRWTVPVTVTRIGRKGGADKPNRVGRN